MNLPSAASNVLHEFWFGDGSLEDPAYINSRMKIWFGKAPAFDQRIRDEFAQWLDQDFSGWKSKPRDFLSLVILHDQIPRNAFRGHARSFAYDQDALALTREGIARGYDRSLPIIEAFFLLLPLEHSESLEDQHLSVALQAKVHARAPKGLQNVTQGTLEYAQRHASVIERFGRFPHRNVILGRTSTEDEKQFLKTPGSRF